MSQTGEPKSSLVLNAQHALYTGRPTMCVIRCRPFLPVGSLKLDLNWLKALWFFTLILSVTHLMLSGGLGVNTGNFTVLSEGWRGVVYFQSLSICY